MKDLGFYLFWCLVVVLYYNAEGHFDNFIKDRNFIELKECDKKSKECEEVIKELQDRLEKYGIDNGIG